MAESSAAVLAEEPLERRSAAGSPLLRGHLTFIDGMRGLAALGVAVWHSRDLVPRLRDVPGAWRLWGCGGLGVDVFFAISGFVIMRGLAHEQEATGTISLKNFYLRRTIRIWPLFYTAMATAIFFGMLGASSAPSVRTLLPDGPPNATLLGILLFYGNYLLANGPHPHAEGLGVSWTLAVEEQFYLVWPSVVRFGGRRAAVALAAASMLACPVLRYRAALVHGVDSSVIYPTHLRADALLTAALAAIVLAGLSSRPAIVRRLRAPLAWTAALGASAALLALGFGLHLHETPLRRALVPTAIALGASGVLFLGALRPEAHLLRPLSTRVMRHLGRVSFSMYMVHEFGIGGAMWLLRRVAPGLFGTIAGEALVFALLLAAAIGLATLTYHVIEAPCLRRVERLKRRAAGARPVATTSVLAAA